MGRAEGQRRGDAGSVGSEFGFQCVDGARGGPADAQEEASAELGPLAWQTAAETAADSNVWGTGTSERIPAPSVSGWGGWGGGLAARVSAGRVLSRVTPSPVPTGRVRVTRRLSRAPQHLPLSFPVCSEEALIPPWL